MCAAGPFENVVFRHGRSRALPMAPWIKNAKTEKYHISPVGAQEHSRTREGAPLCAPLRKHSISGPASAVAGIRKRPIATFPFHPTIPSIHISPAILPLHSMADWREIMILYDSAIFLLEFGRKGMIFYCVQPRFRPPSLGGKAPNPK